MISNKLKLNVTYTVFLRQLTLPLIFRYLAKVYAGNHRFMKTNNPKCPSSDNQNFPGGITNGAFWYDVTGGMQVTIPNFKDFYSLINHL